MKTLERDEEKRVPPTLSPLTRLRASRNDSERFSVSVDSGRWARISAMAGAAVWAGIAVLARVGIARIGAIELLFMFAPLVIVPLGLELMREMGRAGSCVRIARRIQPLGAAMAAVAITMPPGTRAAILALGWFAVCGLAALEGLLDLVSRAWGTAGRNDGATFEVAMAVAKIDLAVGGAWLVASRLGMRPMGIQEPIGLLTAVHFHFAGFATALIAAATLRFVEQGRLIPLYENGAGLRSRLHPRAAWLKAIVILVIGMPFVVAAGFVISPTLKMGAGVLFASGVAALAVILRGCGQKANDAVARVLLQVSAGAVLVGMIFAAAYAVADFLGSDALPIPQMARTHGLINAFGFCMTGLLGWLVENNGQLANPHSSQNRA